LATLTDCSALRTAPIGTTNQNARGECPRLLLLETADEPRHVGDIEPSVGGGEVRAVRKSAAGVELAVGDVFPRLVLESEDLPGSCPENQWLSDAISGSK